MRASLNYSQQSANSLNDELTIILSATGELSALKLDDDARQLLKDIREAGERCAVQAQKLLDAPTRKTLKAA